MFCWAKSHWAPAGQTDLIPLSHGFFLVKLLSEGDRNKILSRGPWQFGNKVVFLRKWALDFDPETENSNLKMVWLRLPDLPHHFWLDEAIQSIGSFIGTFLSVDRASRTMAYARLCVLVDANATLSSFMEISSNLGILRQEIWYDNPSVVCSNCLSKDHLSDRCPLKKTLNQGKKVVQEPRKPSRSNHRKSK